jgi:hypothetical protein
MKTQIIISALAFFSMIPVLSQESQKKVQIRIIENGKVTTDTTFSVREDVNRKDIDRAGRMLNKEDIFEFREMPGGKNFSYSFHFDGVPEVEMDSVMRSLKFYRNDSLIREFTKKFHEDSALRMLREDSAFIFNDLTDLGNWHLHMRPPHMAITERDIIIDKDMIPEDFDNVIIERKGPGKRHIIIQEKPGDVKTIRKRLDNDTEVIIIKKDSKKNKPEKDISRKRER